MPCVMWEEEVDLYVGSSDRASGKVGEEARPEKGYIVDVNLFILNLP